jgi:hypothetical protein
MAITKPILRIFNYDKAIEFYINWLNFKINWEHNEAEIPIYMEISKEDIFIHLSEHHGDASPGARIFIDNFKELSAYHKLLIDKQYKFNKPGIHAPFYDANALEMTVYDPFGNRLTFVERDANNK